MVTNIRDNSAAQNGILNITKNIVDQCSRTVMYSGRFIYGWYKGIRICIFYLYYKINRKTHLVRLCTIVKTCMCRVCISEARVCISDKDRMRTFLRT